MLHHRGTVGRFEGEDLLHSRGTAGSQSAELKDPVAEDLHEGAGLVQGVCGRVLLHRRGASGG